jgi:hypothetical protein
MTFDIECRLYRIRSLSRAVTASIPGLNMWCYRRGICLLDTHAREITLNVQCGYAGLC